MIGVAAGLALEGYRPIVHSYAPFLVERPYEQIKLDLGHQDLGAILVSYGASYDASRRGARTRRPRTSPCSRRCPAGRSRCPAIADESERMLARAENDDRVYIRLTDEKNARAASTATACRPASTARRGAVVPQSARRSTRCSRRPPTSTRRRLPDDACARSTPSAFGRVHGTDVVLVEPYLAGTSAGEVTKALNDRPHRLLALGVDNSASCGTTATARSIARRTGSTPVASARRSERFRESGA